MTHAQEARSMSLSPYQEYFVKPRDVGEFFSAHVSSAQRVVKAELFDSGIRFGLLARSVFSAQVTQSFSVSHETSEAIGSIVGFGDGVAFEATQLAFRLDWFPAVARAIADFADSREDDRAPDVYFGVPASARLLQGSVFPGQAMTAMSPGCGVTSVRRAKTQAFGICRNAEGLGTKIVFVRYGQDDTSSLPRRWTAFADPRDKTPFRTLGRPTVLPHDKVILPVTHDNGMTRTLAISMYNHQPTLPRWSPPRPLLRIDLGFVRGVRGLAVSYEPRERGVRWVLERAQ